MTMDQPTANAIASLGKRRMADGLCRHCGGKVPCWSRYGDHAVGKRHTGRSYSAMQARLNKEAAARWAADRKDGLVP